MSAHIHIYIYSISRETCTYVYSGGWLDIMLTKKKDISSHQKKIESSTNDITIRKENKEKKKKMRKT